MKTIRPGRVLPLAPTLARVALPMLLALSMLPMLAGCGGSSSQSGAGGPGAGARGPVRFPVELAPVEARAVEYSLRAVGSVEAFEQVAATARVAGVVEKVRFQEGDRVEPTTVLAEIDTERYRLAVDAARSSLARAEAAVAEARAGLERRESVNAKNPDLVRAEEVDAWRTQLAAATAEADGQRTALALAELNYRDAFVRSPFAGVVQTRSVETGRYVQPGTVIATLLRRDPLLLRFSVPETDVAPLVPGQEVRFRLRGSRDTTYAAKISLVAAAADPRDRMVAITARIDDTSRTELRPGAFAEIEVPVGGVGSAPVIPQTAIRPSDRGFLAFVVEDGVARERVLELGLRTAGGEVEVRSGIAVGEQLVVRGAEALRDGAPVVVEAADAVTGTRDAAAGQNP